MNVYEYAMKVEKDGEAYYKELASKSPNAGLKKVFTLLADAEVKHYQVFKSMRDKDGQDFKALDISTDTKTIFETLKAEKTVWILVLMKSNFMKMPSKEKMIRIVFI